MKKTAVVIGVGGAGVSIAKRLEKTRMFSDMKFLYVDSDKENLSGIKRNSRIVISPLGEDEVVEGNDGDACVPITDKYFGGLFKDEGVYRTAFILLGAAGGFAGKIVHDMVKDLSDAGIKINIIAAMPFRFESEERKNAANNLIDEMKKLRADVYTFDNDRLLDDSRMRDEVMDRLFEIVDMQVIGDLVRERILDSSVFESGFVSRVSECYA